MAKTPEQLRDELLVVRCQIGEREAFEQLVNRWQRPLWGHAFRLTGSEDAAWDAVQDAWVRIVKGIRRLEDAAAFPAWAFRIVTNRCTDRRRADGRRARLQAELRQKVQPLETGPQDGTREALASALARLPAEQQALLSLLYTQGFTVAEIASILGIPEGTVKSRLYHARERLREIIKE